MAHLSSLGKSKLRMKRLPGIAKNVHLLSLENPYFLSTHCCGFRGYNLRVSYWTIQTLLAFDMFLLGSFSPPQPSHTLVQEIIGKATQDALGNQAEHALASLASMMLESPFFIVQFTHGMLTVPPSLIQLFPCYLT
ncbi:hypothetical protein JHK84_034181 [Glycine max]|nr:hypothetical protein JHK86_033924 [Glycine max]KAG5140413.1 hypothetical protein JHK84_034181 [Glycine max]